MASRSGGDDSASGTASIPEGVEARPVADHLESTRADDGAEVTVHLKVGYKTVLLIVVVFDLVHLSLREFFDASWVEQLLGLS